MILGIDPGSKGALSCLSQATNGLEIIDIPTYTISVGGKVKRRLDLHQLAKVLFDRVLADEEVVAVIEDVHAMPKQGVASSFTFGRNFGALEMGLAANSIPVHYVAPHVWKRILRVPADKDGARKRASELLPRHAHLWPLRSHDGRAESALLAFYGWKFVAALHNKGEKCA